MESVSLYRVSVAQCDHTSDAISDPKALESVLGVHDTFPSLLEGLCELEEAGWSQYLSKGSVSPRATIRQLKGA